MKLRVGFALCGSYCTYERVIDVLKSLCEVYDIIPIMSETAVCTDSRFGAAEDFKNQLENLTGRKIIGTMTDAEPIGPQKLLDVLVVAPCTGNTVAKLAAGISDTTVTLAAKAHLRNGRPVILGVSTNDGLSGNAANIGALLCRKNIYFVPFEQDDPVGKPTSLVAVFEKLAETIEAAAAGRQIQPLLAK